MILEQALTNMTAAMAHRGPDDSGVEVLETANPSFGVGSRRLAVQDTSMAGHQPMQDLETGNWLVFNGEIYNFRELSSELQHLGVTFRSGTDTEVLLRAYATWGLESIKKLRGMFAFALWDAEKDQVVLARDPVGVKPLYYAESNGSVLFASEVRALLRSGLVRRRLSAEGLVSYLALGAVQEPFTINEGVQAFPPGHYAVCKDGRVDFRRYWSPEECFQAAPLIGLKRKEAVDLVRSALTKAVRLRLTSDVPIGTFLSGGIDSSAVTALAAQLSGQPVRTVSVVFREPAFSEQPYMDQVRQRYSTNHTMRCVSAEEMLRDLPEVFDAMDQPTFDGMNTYIVSREAHLAGLTVVLSGIGGDELFGGYSSFRRVPMLHQMRRWIPSILRRTTAEAVLRQGRQNDQAWKLARWLRADSDMDGAPEALLRELFAPSDREHLMSREVTGGGDGRVINPLQTNDIFNSISYFEMTHYLRNVLLRDTDVMGMAHSLEIREPLLDQELIELVAALPGSLKQNGKRPKPLLAEAVHNDVPSAVLTRSKKGFAFPFAPWLRGPLATSLKDTILDPRLGGQVAEMVDSSATKRALERFNQGSATWVRVWSLYVLKQWGERHS